MMGTHYAAFMIMNCLKAGNTKVGGNITQQMNNASDSVDLLRGLLHSFFFVCQNDHPNENTVDHKDCGHRRGDIDTVIRKVEKL